MFEGGGGRKIVTEMHVQMNALKCRTLATKMCLHACIHLIINKKITLNIINN